MQPLRVGHLVSGSGTTMDHVAKKMLTGELGDIVPAVVIADRPCGAIEKATQLDIARVLLQKSDYRNDDVWASALEETLMEHEVDIVFQNGWTPWTPKNVVNRWQDTIYNQHPGPLSGNGKPDFGGKGMCGTAVTAARILYLLESGEEDPRKLTTESTIHMVTPLVDDGHLVRVQPYSIADIIVMCRRNGITTIEEAARDRRFHDYVGTAQAELLSVEHTNVAQVLWDRASGRRTRVEKDERANDIDVPILRRAKTAAINMYPIK